MSIPIHTISVVVPCYNSELFIKDTIDSIISNRSEKISLEIIAVNDNSTDNTLTILKQYGSAIKIIDKVANEGTCKARNVGIRAASGDYVALCDHDDKWTHDKLLLQMERFNDPHVGLVCSDAVCFSEQVVLMSSMAGDRPLKRGDVFCSLLYTNFIIQSSVVIRREVFEDVGLFNEQIFPAEDLDLWLRITQKWHVDYVEKTLVYYRISSMMFSSDKVRMKQARIPVISKYAELLINKTEGRKVVASALTEFAMDYWHNRQFVEAKSKLIEAIKCEMSLSRCIYLLLTYLPHSLVNLMLSIKKM
jgi:glycosyltransferase involved in cell wall biosynthesis